MVSQSNETLPLSVMRHGMSLILAGLVWGFFIPQMPLPRLALTAHVQFLSEGALVLLVGLLLASKPFPHSDRKLASTFSSLQARIVHLGCIAVWPVILSEVANSWWGTKNALPMLYAAGVKEEWSAKEWQELVLVVTHFGGAPFMVGGMGIVLLALFKQPKLDVGAKRK
ncbi:hypothetical protein HDV00_007353 [Rhizophlyctis rosea]|nr:hypothetical protein HDV00_007353 [Rhizophlyctis rosea]